MWGFVGFFCFVLFSSPVLGTIGNGGIVTTWLVGASEIFVIPRINMKREQGC